MYLRAVFISRIVDWFHNADCKQWVKLEEEVTAIKLKSLPWISREKQTPRGDMLFLVGSTLKVWVGLRKRGIGSTYIGPMTPLFSNPEFPPATEAMTFLKWQRNEDTRLVQTMEGNGKLLLKEQRPTHALSNIYRHLISNNKEQEVLYIKKWEGELGITIPRVK